MKCRFVAPAYSIQAALATAWASRTLTSTVNVSAVVKGNVSTLLVSRCNDNHLIFNSILCVSVLANNGQRGRFDRQVCGVAAIAMLWSTVLSSIRLGTSAWTLLPPDYTHGDKPRGIMTLCPCEGRRTTTMVRTSVHTHTFMQKRRVRRVIRHSL